MPRQILGVASAKFSILGPGPLRNSGSRVTKNITHYLEVNAVRSSL